MNFNWPINGNYCLDLAYWVLQTTKLTCRKEKYPPHRLPNRFGLVNNLYAENLIQVITLYSIDNVLPPSCLIYRTKIYFFFLYFIKRKL